MYEVFADLHVHIGRTENGKPIKITAARSLNFANIAKECAERKGINIVGIIDCASPYVIEDIENFLKTGEAYELEDGGIIYKDKVCILLGSEVETSEKGRNGKCGAAHNVCFFPHLKDIKAFSNEMSHHIKNITLSTQRSDISGYELIDIVKNNKKLSYHASYELLNSKDFSVAQNRERLIYIAIRSDISEKLNIKPEDIFNRIKENNKDNKIFILNDVLKDIKPLDAPRVKNMTNVNSEISDKKIDVNYYEDNENEYLKLINENRKIPYIFNHKARYCNDINYEIYDKLDQGDDSTNEKIKDIMPYSHRNHVFKDKYYKLIADNPCRTITAHMRMDCHSHIHPFQTRALTPREAARVQSFPDDYLFWGPYLKTYMQIGNAVPPVMARGIANVIKNYLISLN